MLDRHAGHTSGHTPQAAARRDRSKVMSKHSRISGSMSPLLWLAPLPFVLAMCLPVDAPRVDTGSAPLEQVAAAPAQPVAEAASAATAAR
jgi:hypothetical protein